MMYICFISRRNEFGVDKSRFSRWSPVAGLSMRSMKTLRRACLPVNCVCIFSPVAERGGRSSKETVPSGGRTSRLFWPHPYRNPRLRRSSSSIVSPPVCVTRLRRPGSAWTAASSTSRLGCWAPQLTAGQGSGTGVAALRGPQPQHERGACGTLGDMEIVPPCSRAGAFHNRPHTPHLLWCHPGRHAGTSRSPSYRVILQLVPRRSVS